MKKTVQIEWDIGCPAGEIRVRGGRVARIAMLHGGGRAKGARFRFASPGRCRLSLSIADASTAPGSATTVVSVVTDRPEDSFSFFLRDVRRRFPILLPDFHAVVLDGDDPRIYQEVARDVTAAGGRTELRRFAEEPEEDFDSAAAETVSLTCPTWLGLGRDVRIFEMGFPRDGDSWFSIGVREHGTLVNLPEIDGKKEAKYLWFVGRGIGCRREIRRWIEDGTLPILHAEVADADVAYDLTAFATLEASPLAAGNVRGTHYLVAQGCARSHSPFTETEQQRHDALLREETVRRTEETVLLCRVTAVNRGPAPRYAWFKIPRHIVEAVGPMVRFAFDGRRGFAAVAGGKVYCVARLEGKPMVQEEVAVLLDPGETAQLEFALPHRPIPPKRAEALARFEFDARHRECRAYWQRKLDAAAKISVPDRRIEERIKAGLLHIDLVTYGREPNGPLSACVGWYTAIGNETAFIIQFMDSMGWTREARRALTYFLEKQREDGFIQNFANYQIETPAVLWAIGEHYRYTRDDRWIRSIAPKLIKACDYVLRWRQKNRRADLRGRGYGMLDGKTADPEDYFRAWSVNAYAYAGLAGVAEALRRIDPAYARRLATEAAALKRDIRTAFYEAMARSPVVPLGDGTWCSSCPPWAEGSGPTTLYADPGNWFTHGTFTARDMISAVYLPYLGVLSPHEPATDRLMRFQTELLHLRNVAFSEPNYSCYPFVHLLRGETGAFLKAHYNILASLADRETTTFWEHYYHVSPHKVAEEAKSLLYTRQMLYLERGRTLDLLAGIPRRWLAGGNRIDVQDARCHFGRLSFRVESHLDQAGSGTVEARVATSGGPKPDAVRIRLPHPLKATPKKVRGGTYDAKTETVVVMPFRGRVDVAVLF